MAVLTEDQLKSIFHDVTVEMTGLDTNRGVRNTYPERGQPAWKIDENIVFVTIQPIDNIYDKLRDTVYSPQTPVTGQELAADQSVSYTRVMQVDWVIYGPDSFTLADKIRFGILTESILANLAAFDIAPLTEPPTPRMAKELFAGQWWPRYDFRANFNVLTERVQTVPYLEGAQIQVHTEQGLYGTIDIEE